MNNGFGNKPVYGYRFKQPFLTVKLVEFLEEVLERWPFKNNYQKSTYEKPSVVMKIRNRIERFRSHRCSVIINGEYIFDATEAKKQKSNLVEKYIIRYE